MRALAEFIMRGRLQASLVALVGNLVPLISPAAVGLVTLRRSFQDGLLVLLWAAIPSLVTLYLGSTGYLVVLASLTPLVAIVIAAEVLKGTVSWPITLVAILAICGLATLAAGGLLQQQTAAAAVEVQALTGKLDALQEEQASPFHVLMAVIAAGVGTEKVSAAFVLGFVAMLSAVNVIGGLLLSRWWQALLYNPGGFREEFHSLRFGQLLASALMLALVGLQVMSPSLMPWASMMGIPLLLAGVGLVHHTVNAFGLGVAWLVMFYLGLVLVGPLLSMVLIGVGFLDSFVDFRTRIARLRKS